MSIPRRIRVEASSERATVSQLELFFDLVFVFALTQVTDLLAHDSTAVNVVRAVLVLSVMWWSWVGYAWLGNIVRADEGIIRVGMFAATAAAFLISLVIPEAFDDMSGGLSGPVVLAVAYFTIRVIHLGLFWIISADDPQLRGQLVRWIPSLSLSTALLLVASQVHGTAQTLLWLAALGCDYVGTLFAGDNWRLRSPGHFAERHGLIVIVALGESIVAIGVGVAQLPISWPIIAASLLALAVSGLLWWAYFDVTALMVEHELDHADGARQVRIARNSYSFGHLPMVIGIVGLSLGLKKVLNYVGDEEHHGLGDPLYGIPLYTLYGGVALFLLALVYFKWYAVRLLAVQRVVAIVVVLVLIPVAIAIPALLALALLALILAVLIGFEYFRFSDPRDQVRHATAG